MRRLISVGGLSVGFGFYVAIVSCSDLIEPLPGPDSGPPLGQLITRTDPSCVAPPYGSFVVYQAQGNNHLFRMPAKVGAIPEDISTKLDPLGTGSDEFVNVSPDGDWLLVGSTRFGCNDPCVALVKRDVCTAQVVVAADGTPVPANGTAAVASGGNLVVYPAEAQPHQRDLFVVKRTGPTTWSAPVNLTAKSPGTWNQRPAISDDGTKMVFDCGPDPNSGAGTSLCVMGLDGNGLVATNPGDLGMQVTAETYLAHGDFATDGTLVCEATLNGASQIWDLQGKTPRLLNGEQLPTGEFKYGGDTGPCSLPDGNIVSSWSLRDPAKGLHELKITDLAGTNPQLLLGGVDVVDNGIGCSK